VTGGLERVREDDDRVERDIGPLTGQGRPNLAPILLIRFI